LKIGPVALHDLLSLIFNLQSPIFNPHCKNHVVIKHIAHNIVTYLTLTQMDFMITRFYKPLALGAILLGISTACMAQTGPPVETNKANSDYKPAFAGQTRIGSVKSKTQYTATVINTELQGPWGMHVLPDGRLIISGKPGNMQILTADGKLDKTITGFPPVVFQGQGGMLDLCRTYRRW
jgi:glucose/arabinose dehydrogenase